MKLSGDVIGTYRPQYRPLSAIRYLDINPLPTSYTLFITFHPSAQAAEHSTTIGWCEVPGARVGAGSRPRKRSFAGP
jgi:hypothetical protein